MSHRMPVMERTRGPEFRRECVPYYVQQPLRQPRHAPERAKIGTPDHFRLERPGDHAPAGSRRAIKGGGTAHAVRRRAAAAALIVFTGTGGLVFTVIPFTVVFLRTGKTGTALRAIAVPPRIHTARLLPHLPYSQVPDNLHPADRRMKRCHPRP